MSSRSSALTALKKLHRQPIDMTLTPRELFSPEEMAGPKSIERGIPIVAASILEQTLEAALLSRMPHLTTREKEQLFGPNGDPLLATFSAKTRLSYALRVINKETRDDLDLIRYIRNAFAHIHGHIDFDTPEIIDACEHFHLINNWIPNFLMLRPTELSVNFK
jgi:hypothetical protein